MTAAVMQIRRVRPFGRICHEKYALNEVGERFFQETPITGWPGKA
jgi:hypothetical protein